MTETCPICRKLAAPGTHPFCSTRCADIDLGRWLTESYTLPIRPNADEDDEQVD